MKNDTAIPFEDTIPAEVKKQEVRRAFDAFEEEGAEIADRPVGAIATSCAATIEIELLHEDGSAVAREPYRVESPGLPPIEGTLDDRGFARVSVAPGQPCKVTFPRLDRDAWERI